MAVDKNTNVVIQIIVMFYILYKLMYKNYILNTQTCPLGYGKILTVLLSHEK